MARELLGALSRQTGDFDHAHDAAVVTRVDARSGRLGADGPRPVHAGERVLPGHRDQKSVARLVECPDTSSHGGYRDDEDLIASQRVYYDLRAPDFGDVSAPDRAVPGLMHKSTVRALVDEFRPEGEVLELACGPGTFTRELERYARSLTAVDSSQQMLDRNQRESRSDRVRYVREDIFTWMPDGQYDVVFFANWLSHVPPTRFDDFWSRVARSLKRHGRVGFLDEDERASEYDDSLIVGGVPAARRTLRDGRTFDIVKVFWRPDDLEARLRSRGWNARVRRVGESFLFGVAEPPRQPRRQRWPPEREARSG